MQITDTILMIRPAAFGFNPETAVNNFFQSPLNGNSEELHKSALSEFDNMVELLKENDIEVLVVEDTEAPSKPDAVFPNNWLCTSPEGTVSVFPMFAPSRRREKRDDILSMLDEKFKVKSLQDWTRFESEGKFLEGSGSMVMDHNDKVIYACYSPRTDLSVLEKYANANGYRAIVFLATDRNGNPVYHTNVVLTIGENFAVFCQEAIDEEWEQIAVCQLLEATGHEIITISREQMHAFAGNMLQLINKKGKKYLALSQTAFDTLDTGQKERLSFYSTLLPVSVPTIEKVEGGSVRCMMTEVFLERK